jgi:hypothetical protein
MVSWLYKQHYLSSNNSYRFLHASRFLRALSICANVRVFYLPSGYRGQPLSFVAGLGPNYSCCTFCVNCRRVALHFCCVVFCAFLRERNLFVFVFWALCIYIDLSKKTMDTHLFDIYMGQEMATAAGVNQA